MSHHYVWRNSLMNLILVPARWNKPYFAPQKSYATSSNDRECVNLLQGYPPGEVHSPLAWELQFASDSHVERSKFNMDHAQQYLSLSTLMKIYVATLKHLWTPRRYPEDGLPPSRRSWAPSHREAAPALTSSGYLHVLGTNLLLSSYAFILKC